MIEVKVAIDFVRQDVGIGSREPFGYESQIIARDHPAGWVCRRVDNYEFRLLGQRAFETLAIERKPVGRRSRIVAHISTRDLCDRRVSDVAGIRQQGFIARTENRHHRREKSFLRAGGDAN